MEFTALKRLVKTFQIHLADAILALFTRDLTNFNELPPVLENNLSCYLARLCQNQAVNSAGF